MIEKEFRALLPAWTACAATMIVCASGGELLRYFGVPAYFVGAAALGALSMGHEYHNRTLHLILSAPVSRQRVLLTKLGVLALLLAGLAALSTVTVTPRGGDALFGRAFLWLPVLAALCIAPWLTMAGRSAVGGAVFTLAIAGVLLVIGEWVGVARHGYTGEVDVFRVMFLSRALFGLSAAGAFMTWRTFLRLEAIDGRGPDVDLAPRRSSLAMPRARVHRSPMWLLVRKELRIQQLTFAIAAIYVVSYLALVVVNRGRAQVGDVLFVLPMFCGTLLALTTGALASAEERHLGTLEAQLLLPVAASRQFAVKTGTALALSLLLAVLLPAALVTIVPPEPLASARGLRPVLAVSTALAVSSMTALGLYVSTLSASALWALLASLPATALLAFLILDLASKVVGVVYSHGGAPAPQAMQRAGAALTVGVIALVLRFALANHRSADRGTARTAAQLGAILTAVVAAIVMAGVAGALGR